MVFKIAQIAIATVLLWPCALFARTQLYSSSSDQPGIFLDAIGDFSKANNAECKQVEGVARAGIITHHFLASRLMVEFFACLARQSEPKRVILIGPDHFQKGLRPISVSSLPWKTPFGELPADHGAVKGIEQSLQLDDDPEAFSGEHSIGVLVPFIRYYFPMTKIVPIILQRNIQLGTLIRLKDLLAGFLDDPKTLVLLSMDFSHNQTSGEADLRDEKARSVIENMDYRRTGELDIDCHPGLKVLLAALQERRNIRPKVLNHSNSARLTGQMNISNVTSYFTVLFYESPDGTGQKRVTE